MTSTQGSSAQAGPSRLVSSSLTSSSPRKTFYPVWPESHDEAEYFEVPPDHFLAQQRGPNKSRQSGTSDPATARRASTSSSTTSNQAVAPLAGSTPATEAAFLSSSPSSSPQPLSELANAVRAGIPAVPSSLARVNNPLDRLTDAVPRPSGFSTVSEEIPDTSTLAAADFDVDVRSGFLPPEAPVQRLSGVHANHWELALDEAKRIPLMQGGGGVTITPRQRFLARRWRRSIREMPILPLSDELANDIRQARRGHVVLSFLAHFYIHSQPRKSEEALAVAPQRTWLSVFSRKSAEELQDEQDLADELAGKFMRRVPAAIAVPWVQLSQKLDLPPVLTYATTVLWNWNYIDPSRGLEPDNLRIVETFTDTPSEHHFFFTSLLIEARGVEALELMRVSLDEAFVADRVARRRIAGYLNRLAVVIKDLTKLLHDVRTACDPKTFYWGIRPWFVGSDTVDDGEEAGWQFEGVDPEGVKRTFSGPSAGQSSMIHAIDVFLDVDHTRRKERLNRPAASSSGDARGADATFMERMSLYMPGHHRAFLSHLRNISFDNSEDDEDEDEDEAAHLNASRVSTLTTSDDDGVEGDVERDVQTRELPHPIRSLALKAKSEEHNEGLPAAYDNALKVLKALRDEHMKIAYLYIVAQARGSPPDAYAPLPKRFTGNPAVDRRLAAKATEAEADAALDTNSKDNGGGAKGTGGTDLVTFLRDCRVNTIDALITAKDAVIASSSTLSHSVVSPSSATPSNVDAAGSASRAGTSSGQSHVPLYPAHDALSSQSPAAAFSSDASQSNRTDKLATVAALAFAPSASVSDPELQIWAVDISAQSSISEQDLRDLTSILLPGAANAGEREKVSRYYRHVDRVRSLVARLLPRLLIAKQFGVAWESIAFRATQEGRPYVSAPLEAQGRLDYNISHDSDWVVMAFTTTKQRRVGVDVMAVQLPKYEQSVRSFAETMDMALTSAETAWVLQPLSSDPATPLASEEALQRLYTLWTYKEAYTKNLGKGLGFDFARIQFDFPSTPISSAASPKLRIDGQEETEYSFVDILLHSANAAPSQLVVCYGPQPLLERDERFREQITAEQAMQSGLLRRFSLHDLIEHTRSKVSP